jgi:hypothetical protein
MENKVNITSQAGTNKANIIFKFKRTLNNQKGFSDPFSSGVPLPELQYA